jgi:flavin reductase (DIM6/NTAB) family NADH-FMN oxidoreductase RutF
MNFIGTFGFKSGRDIDKFAEVNYTIGTTKSPVLSDNCLGYFEANVIDQLDVGTHTIFVGEIVNDRLYSSEPAMTYEYYQEIKGGRAPKTAPTYQEK